MFHRFESATKSHLPTPPPFEHPFVVTQNTQEKQLTRSQSIAAGNLINSQHGQRARKKNNPHNIYIRHIYGSLRGGTHRIDNIIVINSVMYVVLFFVCMLSIYAYMFLKGYNTQWLYNQKVYVFGIGALKRGWALTLLLTIGPRKAKTYIHKEKQQRQKSQRNCTMWLCYIGGTQQTVYYWFLVRQYSRYLCRYWIGLKTPWAPCGAVHQAGDSHTLKYIIFCCDRFFVITLFSMGTHNH